jgi:hypothetical protein
MVSACQYLDRPFCSKVMESDMMARIFGNVPDNDTTATYTIDPLYVF